MKKRIDLGEYVVTIDYNKETSKLDVRVLDEGGEIIDAIIITDDNDEDEPLSSLNISLN